MTCPRPGSAQRDDPPELARSTLKATNELLEGVAMTDEERDMCDALLRLYAEGAEERNEAA